MMKVRAAATVSCELRLNNIKTKKKKLVSCVEDNVETYFNRAEVLPRLNKMFLKSPSHLKLIGQSSKFFRLSSTSTSSTSSSESKLVLLKRNEATGFSSVVLNKPPVNSLGLVVMKELIKAFDELV